MRMVLSVSAFLGFIGVVSSFTLLYIADNFLFINPIHDLNPLTLINPNEYPNVNGLMLQSFIFLKLAVAGHLTIFQTRTTKPFWSNRPAGVLFWSAVITKILATLVVVYGFFVYPIGWWNAAIVWIYALVAFVLTDLGKVQFYKLFKEHT